MPRVMSEELEPIVDPRVETSLHVLRDLAHDMLAIHQPEQLAARCRRPNRLFALLAVIAEPHITYFPKAFAGIDRRDA